MHGQGALFLATMGIVGSADFQRPQGTGIGMAIKRPGCCESVVLGDVEGRKATMPRECRPGTRRGLAWGARFGGYAQANVDGENRDITAVVCSNLSLRTSTPFRKSVRTTILVEVSFDPVSGDRARTRTQKSPGHQSKPGGF